MIKFVSSAVYRLLIPSTPAQTFTIAAPFYHVSLDGTASPPVQRHYQPWPTGEGGVDAGVRLQPRTLTWRIFVDATTESALEAARTQLYQVLRPSVRPLTLKVERADGAVRLLECFVTGAVEFSQLQQVGYSCLATVQLYAPAPIWYAPTQQVSALTLGSTTGTVDIAYGGNWMEAPTVELTGQLVSPQISDAAGNTISFAGHTIPNGLTYTIDLRADAKTAFSSSGASWPGNDVSTYVVAGTGWNEFRLYPRPLAADSGGGVLNKNTISAAYSSKGAGAGITVRWYNRWLNL